MQVLLALNKTATALNFQDSPLSQFYSDFKSHENLKSATKMPPGQALVVIHDDTSMLCAPTLIHTNDLSQSTPLKIPILFDLLSRSQLKHCLPNEIDREMNCQRTI